VAGLGSLIFSEELITKYLIFENYTGPEQKSGPG